MTSPEEHWWSVRAGEYVLGTLRGEDLILFERILAHDTSMQAEVARWEQQLAGLNETTAERSPGEHVWPQILERVRRLDEDGAKGDFSIGEDIAASETAEYEKDNNSNNSDSSANKVDNVVGLRDSRDTRNTSGASGIRDSRGTGLHRNSILWPTIAGLATAASLVLGVLLLQRVTEPATLPWKADGLAIVLSDESGEPYFLVETDYGSLRVRVTALAPPELDETRDFQLWQALPDRSSVRPVALLPEEPGTSRTFTVDSLIEGSDLFGVSIEPVGAMTAGGPTGPVVGHGDFLPKRDID